MSYAEQVEFQDNLPSIYTGGELISAREVDDDVVEDDEADAAGDTDETDEDAIEDDDDEFEDDDDDLEEDDDEVDEEDEEEAPESAPKV